MNSNPFSRIAFFLLRVVAGFLFFQAGAAKILGWFGGIPPEAGGPPALMSQIGIGGLLELFGGLLVLIGFLTHPVAFVLSGEMAVAYWQFHAPRGGWPQQNEGTDAVLFCFIFLFLAAQGGGPWSVDGWLRRRRERARGMPPAR